MIAPTPPPPPPPPGPLNVGSSNGSHMAMDKSQLLADICKGTTLRKTATKEKCPAGSLNSNVSNQNVVQFPKPM